MRINKDQIYLFRWKDFKFGYKRAHGKFGPFLLNRFQWYYYPRLRYTAKFPLHLDIELSSLCNMRCPMCFTVTSAFGNAMKKGFMEFSLFKKIIDEASSHKIYSIRISHRGEAFMHPEVIKCISYAKESGIKEVASLSNIFELTPALFEKALLAGLDWLTISFDGTGSVYEDIRRPADFKEAYEKVKAYRRIKDKYRFYKPVIRIQSIWPAVKDNLDEYVRLFDPYVDAIAFNPLIDYLHNDDPSGIEYWDRFDCPVPYQRMTVLFDGKVPYCHNDEFVTCIAGDINYEKISDIWRGSVMKKVRKAHRSHRGVELLSACKHCFMPRRVESSQGRLGNKKIIVEKYTKRTEEIGA